MGLCQNTKKIMETIIEDSQSSDEENDVEDIILIITSILCYNSMRTKHYITRSGIIYPLFSSWTFMYRQADDTTFLSCCGLGWPTFSIILQVLWPDGETRTIGRLPAFDNIGKRAYAFLFVYNVNSYLLLLCL
jgi:hypothetical protein